MSISVDELRRSKLAFVKLTKIAQERLDKDGQVIINVSSINEPVFNLAKEGKSIRIQPIGWDDLEEVFYVQVVVV